MDAASVAVLCARSLRKMPEKVLYLPTLYSILPQIGYPAQTPGEANTSLKLYSKPIQSFRARE